MKNSRDFNARSGRPVLVFGRSNVSTTFAEAPREATMITSSHLGMAEQVESIIHRHVIALDPYLQHAEAGSSALKRLIACLDRLTALCSGNATFAADELIHQVGSDLEQLNRFLRLTNQDVDEAFETTRLGAVWKQATVWYSQAQRRRRRISRDEAWNVISPAIPDTLEEVGVNTFEAKWAAPVPVMDLEVLRRTQSVTLCGSPFEPAGMPAGVAIRFTVRK